MGHNEAGSCLWTPRIYGDYDEIMRRVMCFEGTVLRNSHRTNVWDLVAVSDKHEPCLLSGTVFIRSCRALRRTTHGSFLLVMGSFHL